MQETRTYSISKRRVPKQNPGDERVDKKKLDNVSEKNNLESK